MQVSNRTVTTPPVSPRRLERNGDQTAAAVRLPPIASLPSSIGHRPSDRGGCGIFPGDEREPGTLLGLVFQLAKIPKTAPFMMAPGRRDEHFWNVVSRLAIANNRPYLHYVRRVRQRSGSAVPGGLGGGGGVWGVVGQVGQRAPAPFSWGGDIRSLASVSGRKTIRGRTRSMNMVAAKSSALALVGNEIPGDLRRRRAEFGPRKRSAGRFPPFRRCRLCRSRCWLAQSKAERPDPQSCTTSHDGSARPIPIDAGSDIATVGLET